MLATYRSPPAVMKQMARWLAREVGDELLRAIWKKELAGLPKVSTDLPAVSHWCHPAPAQPLT